jgi:hypothetical protein
MFAICQTNKGRHLRKYLKVLPEIRNIQVGHVVVQISVSDKGELAEGVCVVPSARGDQEE